MSEHDKQGTVTTVEEWRAWFAKNVQPTLDKLPDLEKPCPCCAGTKGEVGATCGYCFVCHGRDHCGCEGRP